MFSISEARAEFEQWLDRKRTMAGLEAARRGERLRPTVVMILDRTSAARAIAAQHSNDLEKAGETVGSSEWFAGPLLRWAISAAFAPSSTLLAALLRASVLLNVFEEEIPSDRQSSFGWFMICLTVYAVLRGAVAAIANRPTAHPR